MTENLPITVLVATKNEEANLGCCLAALKPAQRVIVVDSQSSDSTEVIARQANAEVIQFHFSGGYPKKRQWALENITIVTPWVLLVDADEVVPQVLWQEIASEILREKPKDAYVVLKGFHFLGRQFRFGGFSHSAVLFFRTGKARFEQLVNEPANSQDMEIHERLIVNGTIGKFTNPLVHRDFKGLEAYLSRHNLYSTWEARLRYNFIHRKQWGSTTIKPSIFGNTQERRRFLKAIAIRAPFEPFLWFSYHYFFRLGFLEGRAGLIASTIRATYISQVRAKIHELRLKEITAK